MRITGILTYKKEEGICIYSRRVELSHAWFDNRLKITSCNLLHSKN